VNVPRVSVWPPLPPRDHLRPPSPDRPFPLDRTECRLYARARHALFRAVRTIGWGEGDEVLVPAWHHGSEVEALTRAGVTCRFYGLDDRLAPDEPSLEGGLGARTRALYLVHFLGLPQDGDRWRAWCDERGIDLVEDAAQAFLATGGASPVGAAGRLSIFCAYKTVGVPDGGLLVCDPPPPPPSRSAPLGLAATARRHGAWLVQRWPDRLARHAARTPPDVPPEVDDALGDPSSPAARSTARLLARLDLDGVAAARRRHYTALLDQLSDVVPPAFADPPPGSSPFAFPVATDDKDALLGHLAGHGVIGLNLWRHPHPVMPAGAFPMEQRLRETVVGLPVHQHLRPAELDRIVRAVRTFRGAAR
jgi:dTDP-4-amino-4,6-dideoxygalactose transaminase